MDTVMKAIVCVIELDKNHESKGKTSTSNKVVSVGRPLVHLQRKIKYLLV